MIREDNGYKILKPNDDLQKRKEYWEIAKGLQKVDGLETSQYLETIIEDTVEGKYDTKIAEKKVEEYYLEINPDSPENQNREADLVSTRITVCLEKDDFKFSPVMLKSIHKDLFHDILPYKWVGAFRSVNITKDEEILKGKSVKYANWDTIQEYLKYDFDEQKNVRYTLPFTSEQVRAFSNFISGIWQTHPFREGNTRTISTFLIKYLRNLGMEINNDPFKQYSDWFRDALVRSNYSDLQKRIHPEFLYLNMFFENILMNAGHDLNSLDLRCY